MHTTIPRNWKTRLRVAGLSLLAVGVIVGAQAGAESPAEPIATFKLKWGAPGHLMAEYDTPTGITVYRNPLDETNVVVTDTRNHRVKSLSGIGVFFDKWGEPGSGRGQLQFPAGVAVDSRGDVLIVDAGNHRIQKFGIWKSKLSDVVGTLKMQLGRHGRGPGEFAHPTDIALDAEDNMYIVDSANHRIQKFDAAGHFLAAWGEAGGGQAQFAQPTGIAVDAKGRVYVTDTGNHRVQVFTASGKFVTAWGAQGAGGGQLDHPKGITVDRAHRVYVADSHNHRIQKFDATGHWLGTVGAQGRGKGQLSFPAGVAVDTAGNIYVTDSGNHRVQVFEQG